MYLTGSYRHSLDAKSRVTLPAALRKQLDDRVVLVVVQGAIYGFTPESHRAWVASFFPEGYNPRKRRDERLRRWLNANSVTVDLDSAGRVALGKLAASDVAACGIEMGRPVVVLGNDDHFEIWDAERLDLTRAEDAEDLSDLMYDD